MTNSPKIVECPRDAMQGIKAFIPTTEKIEYLNQLLKVGFDTLDFGSFVSAKAIPQMSDTGEIIPHLDLSSSKTKLLAIIGGLRGAEQAVAFDEISYLGFPFSLSETFLKKNINSTIEEAFATIEKIQSLCVTNNKELVLYFSFAFDNPYGDEYSIEEQIEYVQKFSDLGISIFSMADTIGMADAKSISSLMNEMTAAFPKLELGLHLHTSSSNWYEKLDAAISAKCNRIDSVIKGYGGCPLSGNDLVGNLDTNNLIAYLDENRIEANIDRVELLRSNEIANKIFEKYI